MDSMTGPVTDTVRTISSGERVSEVVVTAVADAKGVDPLDLDPLYDSVDPDALDSLFRGSTGAGSATEIRFEMAACEVVVREGNEVVVAPMASAAGNAERVASHE